MYMGRQKQLFFCLTTLFTLFVAWRRSIDVAGSTRMIRRRVMMLMSLMMLLLLACCACSRASWSQIMRLRRRSIDVAGSTRMIRRRVMMLMSLMMMKKTRLTNSRSGGEAGLVRTWCTVSLTPRSEDLLRASRSFLAQLTGHCCD